MDIQGDSEGKVNIFGGNSRIVVSSCDRGFNSERLTRFFFGGGGEIPALIPLDFGWWVWMKVEIYKIKANT